MPEIVDRLRNCCLDLRTHMTELFDGSTLEDILEKAPYMEIKINHIGMDSKANDAAEESEQKDLELSSSFKSVCEFFPVSLDARYLTEDTNYKVELDVPYFRDFTSFVYVTYFTQGTDIERKFILVSEKRESGWKPPNKELAIHLCYYFFADLRDSDTEAFDLNLFSDGCLGVLRNNFNRREEIEKN